MATRIRLQRFGRKSYAFYQIVIADSRAPRDGKFIERIGSYNPNTNPATIDLKFDRALYWLQTGALPTDTARMILSREGVCFKKHLLEGVKKGAFDEATAEQRFEEWVINKKTSLQQVKDNVREQKRSSTKTLLDAEKEVNKAKAAELAKKKADIAAEARAKVEAVAAERAERIAAEKAATEPKTLTIEPEAPTIEATAPEETTISAPQAEEVQPEVVTEATVEETPTAPVEEETPVATAEETPAAPTEEEVPVAPTEEEAPATPVEEETPVAPVEETPTAPAEEETLTTPAAEEIPATPTEEIPVAE
jgi:small subunit ribosomal protein S16